MRSYSGVLDISGSLVRFQQDRTLSRRTSTAASGTSRVRFTGRIGKRALRPGRYRAVLTATDAAGNRSAPRTTRFRVVRG
ncbi:MAG TPA: hypothetical protein VFT95_16310 [Micromonosporaceae bacterium]|nr:hypothetical protein [Micromonosporaceae bacterium]